MKNLLFLVVFYGSLLCSSAAPAPINPKQVAVLYNNQIPESEELAKFYARERNIPRANLIGLELSDKGEISRQEYNETLRIPLIDIFISRGWWRLGKTPQGQVLPAISKITTLVTVRGVPYKIKRSPLTKKNKLPAPFTKANEAAVDSELAICGVQGYPLPGPTNNAYFKKDVSFADAKLPFMLLVGRIDAPSYATCKRLITDAIATEKRGLWGMCYLDIAKKGGNYSIGDEWIESIAKQNNKLGIPTVVDRNKQTFVTNYPMTNASIYYGWYTGSRNGPFLNKNFSFRRGAIAIHLHSFSASNLRNANRNWTGPLLEKGAAATVGNVYEPYLQFTHHFDILQDRLIQGYSLVEAAYMACPSLSWQTIVLGDPLYRPFIHLDGSGEKAKSDRDYRAFRMAHQIWANEPELMVSKLSASAEKKGNGNFYEFLGLKFRSQHRDRLAIAFFQSASLKHTLTADRLRQWLHIADIQRASSKKKTAIATLKHAKSLYPNIPETKSIVALLNILDPPPPPPAKKTPKKPSKKQKKRHPKK